MPHRGIPAILQLDLFALFNSAAKRLSVFPPIPYPDHPLDPVCSLLRNSHYSCHCHSVRLALSFAPPMAKRYRTRVHPSLWLGLCTRLFVVKTLSSSPNSSFIPFFPLPRPARVSLYFVLFVYFVVKNSSLIFPVLPLRSLCSLVRHASHGAIELAFDLRL